MDRRRLLEQAASDVASDRLDEAETRYRLMLQSVPDDAEALSNLAALQNLAERHLEAEVTCRSALQRQPGYWAALSNLGVALHRQQRHEEGIAAYIAALRANNSDVNACTNLAVAFNEQWRMPESLLVHDAALDLAPSNPTVRANRAMALLIAGDYQQGFAEFEWRWQAPGITPHGLTAPLWDGSDPAGKVILVHDEGGFGDTLQFVRYVPMLIEYGAKVLLQVQSPLLRLMRQSFPSIAHNIIARGDWPPPHDLHCPTISLARCFKTTLATVPGQTPYLTADASRISLWKSRLGTQTGEGPRIGLVWAGSPRHGMSIVHAMDRRRSIPPALFNDLANINGVRFVSLQLGANPADFPAGLKPFDSMGEMTDFADTADLVANLDLVISVDTAVAHLAGALGRPVWLLSRFDACWRWLAGRQDSPWYPQMRVFRQSSPGDWAGVLTEVAIELQRLYQA